MSLLELKDVTMQFKSYKRKIFGISKQSIRALSNINLNIDEGKIIAVVGESGCGKTTLGKIITGIHRATQGTLLWQGKNIDALTKKENKEYRLGVQMIHQDSYSALNPNKTIAQSLVLPLLRHGFALNEQKSLEILAAYFNELGLNPPEFFLEKYPHQLSGGQRQRILLARVLSVKPKLIVADEPVSMVDVSLRITLLDLMAKMNKKYNISFVYITHDLATARYIAAKGKIIVMYLGEIIEINDIHAAIQNPAHPYFEALVAAVPKANFSKKSEQIKELPLRSLDLPDVYNIPSGCAFHPRCPRVFEKCMQEKPILTDFNGGLAACHRYTTR